MLDAVIVSPAAPMAGISRPMVVSAAEPIGLELLPESGSPALEVDGTVLRRAEPGESIGVDAAAQRRRGSCGSTSTASSAATRSS